MRTIGFSVDDYGYTVEVLDSDDGLPIEHYRAGNHSMESSVEVDKGHPCRLPKHTLRKFANQTASEMAAEHGVPMDHIFEERS